MNEICECARAASRAQYRARSFERAAAQQDMQRHYTAPAARAAARRVTIRDYRQRRARCRAICYARAYARVPCLIHTPH